MPSTLPVGSICVIGDKPQALEDFSSSDRNFLLDCADMIAREFDLGREQQRRSTELQQSTFLGTLLEDTLVRPLDAPVTPVAPSTTAVRNADGNSATSLTASLQLAAHRFPQLTGAHSAAILDLRSYRAPHRRPDSRAGPTIGRTAPPIAPKANATPLSTSLGDAFQKSAMENETLFKDPNAKGKVYALAHCGNVSWNEILADQERLSLAVSETLVAYYDVNLVYPDSHFKHELIIP